MKDEEIGRRGDGETKDERDSEMGGGTERAGDGEKKMREMR